MQVQFIRTHENAVLPSKGSALAAGHDLYAAEACLVPARSRVLVNTGWRVCVQPGYELQVRARSGLAVKHGIGVLNSPGTVDEDYRGILGVILVNTTDFDFEIAPGDRVAQMVVKPVVYAHVVEVEKFELPSERGEDGYGSTGR